MTLELKIIIGFLLHLVGDYLTQNDWIASGKTSSSPVAFLHAFLYSLPFWLFIMPNGAGTNWPILVLLFTHFFIDRYRLANYWIRLVNNNWWYKIKRHGIKHWYSLYPSDRPEALKIWLPIIIDNVWHLLINTACIYWHHTINQ